MCSSILQVRSQGFQFLYKQCERVRSNCYRGFDIYERIGSFITAIYTIAPSRIYGLQTIELILTWYVQGIIKPTYQRLSAPNQATATSELICDTVFYILSAENPATLLWKHFDRRLLQFSNLHVLLIRWSKLDVPAKHAEDNLPSMIQNLGSKFQR